MSDVKNATIIPYWKVLARFGAHIFPRVRDMHTCCYCETFDEAQDAMDWYIKCGSYSEVRVVQCDMAYVGGLTQGLVGSKVVKRWHARKQEARTCRHYGTLQRLTSRRMEQECQSMPREVSIERFDAHKGEDHAIQMMANAMRDENDWVKPMWRPYFDAMMKLIAQRPDLYRMHGYSCRDIHFRNFKRTGKNNVRLVSCEAYWQQVEGAR